MVREYSRLALRKDLAEEFYRAVKNLGRKPSEVLEFIIQAAVDSINHGVDPIDMVHICRLARSLGLGRGGYEVGKEAGVLLRAYYSPEEFLEILTRVGPKVFHANRVGPNAFRVNNATIRETLRGILEGIGYKVRVEGDMVFLDNVPEYTK
ncbi:hypothetical protein [Pyrobaculum neutrophilum]|uniref:Uncharacterized protein n=1 Tax=Pyrobaculum neutrophilum (strain DSM 2338 / JCM 9278 / NBRC 100436 / V24Sta) TaxID=444157 RepID=B1YBR6_PYRNV|nr:hypothetical protein [Pyrobaculum neutrophilum]ACB39300.1 conserved hypothetical protein [Pyrobaculum neutrophilum V24Sta]